MGPALPGQCTLWLTVVVQSGLSSQSLACWLLQCTAQCLGSFQRAPIMWLSYIESSFWLYSRFQGILICSPTVREPSSVLPIGQSLNTEIFIFLLSFLLFYGRGTIQVTHTLKLINYMGIFACMHACAPFVISSLRGQKGCFICLELSLQIVSNCHVDAGNWTWDLCKRSQCF